LIGGFPGGECRVASLFARARPRLPSFSSPPLPLLRTLADAPSFAHRRTSRSSGLCLISSCRTSSTTSMRFRSSAYLPFLSLPLAPYPLPPITSLPPSPSPSAIRQPPLPVPLQSSRSPTSPCSPRPSPAHFLAHLTSSLIRVLTSLPPSAGSPPPADERAPPLRVHGHLRRHAAHDPQAVPIAEDDDGCISRCVVFVFMPYFLVSFWSWVWDSVLGVLLREVGKEVSRRGASRRGAR
jgi:hypothetical protein